MAELSDIELADQFSRMLSGNVAEWPQLRPLLGRLAAENARLTAEVERLMTTIIDVHSQYADDLCWMDIDRIFEAAGLPVPDRRVGDKEAMKANCVRFIDTMCAGGKWKSYAELGSELAQKLECLREMAATCGRQEARIAELEQMPCDSPTANEWLNKHAPKEIIEALWAWRRISVEGLTKHKEHIGQLMDQVAALTARNAELKTDLNRHLHLVRTMGERCDLLGGLLREWHDHAWDSCYRSLLVKKTQRALAQGEGSE